MKTERLWPVLGVLLGLLAGALFLEVLAKDANPDLLHIDIAQGGAPPASDEDEDDATDTPEARKPASDVEARAQVAARRGELAQAITLFEAALATDPDSPQVLGQLGYWRLVQGDPRGALKDLERARQLAPQDAYLALSAGRARRRLGDLAGAEADFRRALELRPGGGSARLALGSLLRQRGAIDEAIFVLEEAAGFGSNEEVARGLVALARAYFAAGRRQEALSALDEAINRAPAAVEIRVAVAYALLRSGQHQDLEQAGAVLSKAVALAPGVPQVHAAMGRVREALGENSQAEHAYTRALQLEPGYSYARRRLLRLALDNEQFSLARLQADYLLHYGPEEPEHHFLSGLVAARAGDLPRARASYRDAIQRAHGAYPEAYFNLGLLEKSAGKLKAAIKAYEQAITLRRDYYAAMNNLAVALAAAGRPHEAERTYRQALAVRPDYAAAWMNLAGLMGDQKRYAEAMVAYEKVLAARPDDAKARLNLGVAQIRAGQNGAGIATYRALLATHPRYVSAWYNLGLALEEDGKVDEARDAYRQALALDPEHLSSLRKLAAIETRAGSLATALTTYQDLLDRVPGDRAARLVLAELRRRGGDVSGCARDVEIVLKSGPPDQAADRLSRLCAGAGKAPE